MPAFNNYTESQETANPILKVYVFPRQSFVAGLRLRLSSVGLADGPD